MSLRGPAAPRHKTWRRSVDDSYWDSLTRDPSASCPIRGSRPQSAIEGGQLDGWFKHLQRTQQTPNQDQVGDFGDTLSDREVSYSTWRAKGAVASSWGSSSGGTSLCGSSLSSQESLQTSVPSPPERRDSPEKARISQVPKKEQTRVSFLTPVKIGWLPIRRKVMMVGEQGRNSDATRQQVKLKPPITPTIVKNAPSSTNSGSDEEVQRSLFKASAGVRTAWNNPDSPIDKQVPEKLFPAAPVSITPVSWQALKRGWKLNRILALPGSNASNQAQTQTNLDPAPKAFTQSPNVQQDKPELINRTTFPGQSRESVSYKAPLHRTSSVQPLKASHIQTTSATKTLIPQNKAGFSSITISSRKVCRSSSLPLPSASTSQESMYPNSRQIMVQRKATIVKVTEQRVTTSPSHNVKVGQNQPSSQSLDTVVHRRKATIIKVTEHRESFTPNNARRNNEYRHSYTEGLYNENRGSLQQNHAMPYSTPIDSKPIHRSTLNLVMTSKPAIVAPPAKPELRNITSNRPQRPSSCYGNVFENSEENEKKKSHLLTRKLSLDSMQNGGGNQNRGLSANGVKTSGQSNNSEGEMAVPPLTLIKTPDADQTAEDVLALNAAAIIANIKLQRQMSKKKTPNVKSENNSGSSPQDNIGEPKGPLGSETTVQDSVKGSTKSHAAAFVPLSNDIQRSSQNMSLQEALQRSRPDFISRSRRRTQELERKTQERTGAKTNLTQPQINNCPGTFVKGDLYKPRNRVVTRRQQPTSKRPTEVKRRQEEEETRRDTSLNNRQRADLFKKKLLDQVLQRSKD